MSYRRTGQQSGKYSVFISYAREDETEAKRLYNDIKNSTLNIEPWLDKEDILPGQDWDTEIINAIKKSDFFIPLFSSNSLEKIGYVQREFKLAVNTLEEIPPGRIYVIPVRLDDCDLKYKELDKYQYQDLFPDWYQGLSKIFKSIEIAIAKIVSTKIGQDGSFEKSTSTIENSVSNAVDSKINFQTTIDSRISGLWKTQQFIIPFTGERVGTGWLISEPKANFYSKESYTFKLLTKKIGLNRRKKLPQRVDLSEMFPEARTQGKLNSSTSFSVTSLIEYFEKRAYGKWVDMSALFIYKHTRILTLQSGDTGATIPDTFGALTLWGTPPEKYCPYTDRHPDYDREPPAYLYSFAKHYQAIIYFRLDPPNTLPNETISRVKQYLSAGFPSVFGFMIFPSLSNPNLGEYIPFPCDREEPQSGQAVVAVGYDDRIKITNPACIGNQTTGAFLIHNSWGNKWGNKGNAWLPYEYVRKGFALDFWTVIQQGWVDTGGFGSD